MTDGYRQNKSPFASALGDWFLLRTYFLTSKASPNDSEIVIVVIIIVIGEAQVVSHDGGIIAQTVYLDRVFLLALNKWQQCNWRETNGGYRCKADVRFGQGIFLFMPMKVLYINSSATLLLSKGE
jgi:hypothetical protein